jgi:hypothetical protein
MIRFLFWALARAPSLLWMLVKFAWCTVGPWHRWVVVNQRDCGCFTKTCARCDFCLEVRACSVHSSEGAY